ncbi:precorrin-6A reductase [bacterium]|nr:precorrin-6A reductase [bacterium]
MIWIIGGTSEAGILVHGIKGKKDYLITVATETGKEFLDNGEKVQAGRLNFKAMVDFIETNGVKTVVDLSHPYAVEVSETAFKAASQTGCTYFRYSRSRIESETAEVVRSLDECVERLKEISGCVFFTTGSNHIKQFQKVRGSNRFVYRVLPSVESMEICRQNNVAVKDIVAGLGPFSLEMNIATFRDYQADYVVMKNSGKQGGTREKIQACQHLDITPILIDKPAEDGFTNLKELINTLLNDKT